PGAIRSTIPIGILVARPDHFFDTAFDMQNLICRI
ncbi:MAG: hypothetical protein ACI9HK_001463, partial [Pirellulaceae bacterium]